MSDSKGGPEIRDYREELERIIREVFPQHSSADAAAQAVIDLIKKKDAGESEAFIEWMAREYLLHRYHQRPKSRRAFPRIKVG